MRHIRVVLVRPRNPNNIGAAARAMANFGLDDLVVVDPYEPVWRETVAAVGGEDVMRRASKLPLAKAVADCHLVIGATTGRRRKLDAPHVVLPELNAFLDESLPESGRAAILFGSEKSGLRGEDLDRCHAWLSIPTSAGSPSMNLGQAVAVAAYELSRRFAPAPGRKSRRRKRLPESRQIEEILSKALEAFQVLGYKTHIPRESLESQLRQALFQWNLTRKDASMLQWIFQTMAERPTHA